MAVPNVRMGNYKHFKGAVYFVIGEGTHSETMEPLVFYKNIKDQIWARPKDSFLSKVTLPNGKTVPRFEYVGYMGEH